MCDPVNNENGSCDEFYENSLNITPRIAGYELFRPTSEGSSDQLGNGKSDLLQMSDTNQRPSSVITLNDEWVDLVSTPNVKISVNSSEVKKKANNPSQEKREQSNPLETEELCTISQQEEGQPTTLGYQSKGKATTLKAKDLLEGETKGKAKKEKFSCKKIMSARKKKKDDACKICGMEPEDTEERKKTSKDDAGKRCEMEHKDTKECKKTSTGDAGKRCGLQLKHTKEGKTAPKDDAGKRCGMERKDTKEDKKALKDDADKRCGTQLKYTKGGNTAPKDDAGKRCGMQLKDIEEFKKAPKDDACNRFGMKHKDTEEGKKATKDDARKRCGMDTEESKKTFPNDDAGNECSEEDEDIKQPKFLPYWFSTFSAFWQSCKDLNCCNLISYFLFLSFSSRVANSTLVEVPKNAAIIQGQSLEAIDMACESDLQFKLRWLMSKDDVYEKRVLYSGYNLSSGAKSYCTVVKDEPGKCYVNLKNIPEAAQTYICLEPRTLAEASADLIWIGDILCNDSSTENFLNLTCRIRYQGNWVPMMEWTEQNSQGKRVLSVGVNSTTDRNQRVTSTLVVAAPSGSRIYTCTAKFDIDGKPPNTTATNIPGDILVETFNKYQGTDENRYAIHPATTNHTVPIAIVCVVAAAVGVTIVGILIYWRLKERAEPGDAGNRNGLL